jgi:phospholipase/carboxylesterase
MPKIEKFFEYGQKNPKYLTILLHGYGSKGEHLIDIAPELEKYSKNTYFIAPNAPLILSAFPPAYQWFELGHSNYEILNKQIIEANNILDDFINKQLERFNLDHSKLIISGFSQGAMMSLYHSSRLKNKVAGVIAFSGRFINPLDLGEKINSKPEICLIHGNKDDVVPFSHFIKAKEDLRNLDFKLEAHEIDNLGHSIDYLSLEKAQKFLRRITS